MKKYNVLAMDFGASSGRGIIGGFDGSKLTLDEIHRFDNDPVMLSGRFTWDAPSLYSNILSSLTKAAKTDGGVESVGVDTWGVDYAYIDKNGHLMSNPVHYRDTRTEAARRAVLDIVPFCELYGITGIQDMQFNTVYQLYADKTDEPYLQENAGRALFMPDLFNYFLTGIPATEYTIASTGAILDAGRRSISGELLSRLGIDKGLFSDIVQPANILGKITDQVADITDLKKKINVVNTASHDTASAVIAVPADSDDFIYISSGTWSLLGTELSEPMINGLSMKYSFTNEGGVGRTIRFLKNIAGLWLIQESKRQWAREGKRYTYDELSEMAMASKPCAFLIDPDDQVFTPQGNMPARIVEYCGRTGQGRPETPGEIIRCVYDSLALRYRWCIEKINEIRGKKAECMHIVGGGTKETALCGLASDACGIRVLAGPTEATAIGNISSQLIAAGELSSVRQAREIVRASFDIVEYTPDVGARGMWDSAYEKFLEIIEK